MNLDQILQNFSMIQEQEEFLRKIIEEITYNFVRNQLPDVDLRNAEACSDDFNHQYLQISLKISY